MNQNLPDIILASKSKARQDLLRGAGLSFQAIPAQIDERKIEESLSGSPEDLALKLARQKALNVSASHPNALTIGSDQVLELDGQILHKAAGRDEALEKLRRLKGKTHRLISAVAVAKGSEILWEHVQAARLTMHDFDEAFLQSYAEAAGEGLTRAVGAYELESAGSWLFEKIEGDYFTILGLPLLALLGFLRTMD